MVDVAQLVRAPDCGSGGHGFESHHPPLLFLMWLFMLYHLLKKVFSIKYIFELAT
jgi:hypothetical protein